MRRRSQAAVIPDSEDDALLSGTSLRNSSPPRRQEPQRKPSHSRTQTSRVIQDSEDDGPACLDSDTPNLSTTQNASTMAVKVVIPTKKDASPSDSCGSSGIRSADGTTGYSTPATSVGTPAESNIKRTRGRVNASDRAQSLRTSIMTRRASLRGQRGTKRSADDAALSEDEASLETSDAAIAHALQMEEYEQPVPKKQKTAASKRSGQRAPTVPEILDASSDSELSEWDLIEKSLSSEEDLYSSDGSFYQKKPRRQAKEQDQDEDDDEDSDWDAWDRRRREENQVDLPPSWEEQRKARRVSLRIKLDSWEIGLDNRSTNVVLDACRPEEAGEEASSHHHHVGYAKGNPCHPTKGRSAAGINYSQTQTLPIGRLELDDGAREDPISRWTPR